MLNFLDNNDLPGSNNFPRYDAGMFGCLIHWLAKLLRPRFLYRIGEGGGIAEVTMMAFGGSRYRETKRLKESWHGCLIRVTKFSKALPQCPSSCRELSNRVDFQEECSILVGPQSPLDCLCCLRWWAWRVCLRSSSDLSRMLGAARVLDEAL